ncbi:MAG: sugar phosphate nucleotidyltransferase [Alphaproteobacteria bacterium]
MSRRGLVRVTDLSGYECAPDQPIRLAMTRLNASDHLFQLVVDSNRRLLGTVTDGDVRRALLRGVSLDDPVRDCMHTAYVAGRSGDDSRNRELAGGMKFLPILDDGGRVCEVLAPGSRLGGIGTAVVMAGGFGTRLGERTRNTPKPLLPVAGKPILEHVIASLEAAAVPRAYLTLHYLADQVRAFGEARRGSIALHYVIEDQPLGTAGALTLIPDLGAGPVLVVNGDVITDADFAALHDFHVRHQHDATIGVSRYEHRLPFGVVRHDEHGLFRRIDEKPLISEYISAGLYYLEPAVLALIPRGRPVDMPEVLNAAQEVGLRIGLFPIHEYWTDVGRPHDLAAADSSLAGPRNAGAADG